MNNNDNKSQHSKPAEENIIDETNENFSAETNQETIQNEEAVGEPKASETEKLEAEIAEQKDKYIRLLAEFENYKRRTSKERIELIQTAGKDIIVSLLDVLDDCDRAEKQMQTDTDPAQIKEGAFLVFNKFRNIMQSKGVKALESIDKEFDVEHHEAIAEVPVPDKSGKIIDEVQKGYLLNDKLIRHAKVVVGK
ncbi:MAG: nucleotide exchange factor GrpE [Arachidicoccus sp.]|nr:nucleotide exchange factor GrpE [Arachidicoccus sp.]